MSDMAERPTVPSGQLNMNTRQRNPGSMPLDGNYHYQDGGSHHDHTRYVNHSRKERVDVYSHGSGSDGYGGYGYGHWGAAGIFCTILTLVLVALGITLVAFAVQNSRALMKLETTQRYCYRGDGDQVLPGPGDADGRVFGSITFDLVTGQVAWSALYTDTVEPTAWTLHGPLTAASPLTAAAAISLNVGSASGPDGSLVGTAAASLQVQQAVLDAPSHYYLQADNGAFPGGALRASLAGHC